MSDDLTRDEIRLMAVADSIPMALTGLEAELHEVDRMLDESGDHHKLLEKLTHIADRVAMARDYTAEFIRMAEASPDAKKTLDDAIGSADDYTGETVNDYRNELAAATRWHQDALNRGWFQLAELLWQDMQVLEDHLHRLGDPEHPLGGLHMQQVNETDKDN